MTDAPASKTNSELTRDMPVIDMLAEILTPPPLISEFEEQSSKSDEFKKSDATVTDSTVSQRTSAATKRHISIPQGGDFTPIPTKRGTPGPTFCPPRKSSTPIGAEKEAKSLADELKKKNVNKKIEAIRVMETKRKMEEVARKTAQRTAIAKADMEKREKSRIENLKQEEKKKEEERKHKAAEKRKAESKRREEERKKKEAEDKGKNVSNPSETTDDPLLQQISKTMEALTEDAPPQPQPLQPPQQQQQTQQPADMQYIVKMLEDIKNQANRVPQAQTNSDLQERIKHLETRKAMADKQVIHLQTKLSIVENLAKNREEALEKQEIEVQDLKKQLAEKIATIKEKDIIITHLTSSLQQSQQHPKGKQESEKARLRRQRQNRFSNQRKKNRKAEKMARLLNNDPLALQSTSNHQGDNRGLQTN
jgi:hypothetical protein